VVKVYDGFADSDVGWTALASVHRIASAIGIVINSATHQNNTTTSTHDKFTTMSSIEAVIAAMESLEPG
jgi:hypothetical protein